MKGIGARTIPFSLSAFLLITFLVLVMQPVSAQSPFDVDWKFQYSSLVSGAPNSAFIHIRNIALVPIRLVSIGINFPWMQTNSYITSDIQTNLAAAQTLQYTIPFKIPTNVPRGKYSMNTLLRFQRFQANQSGGVEAFAYVLDITVLGQATPFWVGYDFSDGRLYSTMAIIMLVGWYFPRKLRSKDQG